MLAIAPERLDRVPRAVRARALPVRGGRRRRPATAGSWSRTALFGNDAGRHADLRGAARQAAAHDARRAARRAGAARRFDARRGVDLREAAYRVLRLPTVADKTFLDHHRRPHRRRPVRAATRWSGPWQVPVADCAVTLRRLRRLRAARPCAMGERTPLALLDAPASGRMAVGEAITNLAAAPIARCRDVKLSANWMAAGGEPGEDAALFDTVRAVALELCPALGIGIPVGKDSLSMRTTLAASDGASAQVVGAGVADRLGLRAGATTCAAR
ncbi:MAG: hypothetical protein MZW92_68000 [Comamonadaceae bacterium]|nr:hypothetical protein [Comamonadaceae bacterium]